MILTQSIYNRIHSGSISVSSEMGVGAGGAGAGRVKLHYTDISDRYSWCKSYSLLHCCLFYEAICCMSFRLSFCSCVFQSF